MKFLVYVVVILILVASVLASIAFMTLVERKLISSAQNRKGPNVVGILGILQPFADALKLILKESIYPRNARLLIFLLAPLLSLFFSLLSWAFIPIAFGVVLVDTNLGIFYIFAASVLHIYGIILAGWASGSRYSFLGAIRSTAQLVAYDIAIGITICTVVFYTNSLNITTVVLFQQKTGWLAFYLPISFVIFFISSLAETNRHPFDLPEAESELVGGYTTEYSAAFFALFFLGEYCSVLIMVFMINHLFLGGWGAWEGGFNLYFFLYIFKLLFVYYVFILVRAAIPRYRYDQLMRLGWKFVLPIGLSFFFYVFLCFCVVKGLDPHLIETFTWLVFKHWVCPGLPVNSWGEFADLVEKLTSKENNK